jgi:hypothetical protein
MFGYGTLLETAMDNRLILIGAAFAILSISGCATMSSEECVATDWSAIGFEDGARGYTTDRFSNHRKACAKHGITADFGSYQAGRDQGLIEYCQPGRGFDVGVNGGRYYGVCPVNEEADFLDAYNVGHQLYTLRRNVSHSDSAIKSKQHKIKGVKDAILHAEAALIDKETTTEQRIILLAELKDLSEDKGRLESEIRDLYEQRAQHQVQLENYQVMVADYGY